MDCYIKIKGARHNNLKGFDLDIPLNKITVITGVSGAGKSSLAFDTLYAEGQRRYIETFSPYARQFMDRMDRPKADKIEGIPPALAIEQGATVRTSRSTVGTVTEINDFMKMLFARSAELHCSGCARVVRRHSPQSIFQAVNDEARQGDPLAITAYVSGSSPAALRAAGLDRIWKDGRPADLPSGLDSVQDGIEKGCEVLFDRLPFRKSDRKRIIDSIETAMRWGKGRISAHLSGSAGPLRFSSALECPYCDISFREATPNLFSFNSPAGACPQCRGFGRVIDIDPELVVPDPRKTILEGAVKPWTGIAREEFQDLITFCKRKKIPVDVPYGELREEDKRAVFDGDKRFYGIRGFFQWLETKRYKLHVRVFLARYRGYHTCPDCGGSRLVPEALQWRILGKSIADFYSLPIEQAFRWLKEINPYELDEASSLLLSEINRRLGYLIDVGLGYLSLDRQSRTLSGGEMERVSLTKALGSSLVNTLYILDEPTVGLHPRDSQRLISLLKRLRDQGNTIIVVEHDPEIIRAADNIIDLGPGAGENGGRLIYSGPAASIAQGGHSGQSLTGKYLSGKLSIPVPEKRRAPSGFITVRGASEHNLKGIDFKLPLGVMTALTGVSGSGKSTLAVETLYRRLKQTKGGEAPGAGRIKAIEGDGQVSDVALVDQEPIGRTPRATPATYLKALDGIRALLAAQPLAEVRGYKSSYFSFNTAGGRCEECGGEGFEKVEMQFLSDIYLPCPTCDGKRFRDEVLEVKFKDRNIHEILGLTLNEAVEFFAGYPRITNPLAPVISVGLGYLRLGQPINTLSGGEAQRLRLARELGRAKPGKHKDGSGTLFIFDEPTIGLHPADVAGLLRAFSLLVDSGNSILVIEHNPELIKCADYVVDLGPEGGARGGMITGEGTPEEISRLETHTGKSLRPYLKKQARPAAGAARKKAGPTLAAAGNLISVRGAREHNLKDLDVDIPREQLVVITGVSGSGKSTLAFDLLFAEGQRRYIESLPTYIRQYLKIMDRPEIDDLAGIPPTVALEQRMSRSGRRSTVATLTEIYHYLRLLFCKLGVQHCPQCGDEIKSHSAEGIAGEIMSRIGKSGKLLLLAPLVAGKKGIHAELLKKMARLGYRRAFIDGSLNDLEPTPVLSRFKEHDINLIVGEINGAAGCDQALLSTALGFGKGTVHTADEKGSLTTYSENLFCHRCGRGFEPLDPRLFSFNSRQGQCPRCEGIGSLEDFLPELIIADREKSLAANLESLQGRSLKRFVRKLLEEIGKTGIDLQRPVKKLKESALDGILRGGAGFRGMIPLLREYREYVDGEELEDLAGLLGETICPECRGSRLRAEARAVRLKGSGIGEIVSLSAADALELVGAFRFRGREVEIADGIIKELLPRLKFLNQVGLGYLGLDRRGDTLSGGEAQRIRLAAQLGSNLRGICYILDEPTIGLHPRDNTVLISTLKELKDRGNSILVVEHDEETICSADHIIDLGPGAGPKGGRIIAQGTLREIKKNPDSVTGAFLNGSHHSSNGSRLRVNSHGGNGGGGQWLELRNASRHNLKDITVRIPLGTLTCVTGVSGSGKSTLIKEELFPALKDVLSGRREADNGNGGARLAGWQGLTRAVEIDHSPIGRTPRSTPATYVGILDEIRKLFSLVPEARMRGYGPGRFSFNVKGGRCETCAGQGMIKVEMNFLPDVYVGCEECGSKRYNEETLDIRYRGKNIHDVLAMSFREGLDLFSSISSLQKPLELLNDIGLGYLTFGQSSPSLSGGEAQRIKLAKELAWGNGRALYIMDEPTTGLHMADTDRLLSVLQRLVDRGHTVVVIEHNLDIIRSADYIIDLGPEGGEGGGNLVAQGNPHEILKDAALSHTARFLKKRIGR